MKISEFLHLALPEEQWLPTISGVLRQFAEEECYVYESQPCGYLGKGCQARLHINADGTQLFFGFHIVLRVGVDRRAQPRRVSTTTVGIREQPVYLAHNHAP